MVQSVFLNCKKLKYPSLIIALIINGGIAYGFYRWNKNIDSSASSEGAIFFVSAFIVTLFILYFWCFMFGNICVNEKKDVVNVLQV